MPILIYDSGTVSVVSGSKVVAGIGTLWLSNVKAWDWLAIDGFFPVQIESVDSDTSITLSSPWPGSNVTGGSYKITKTGLNSYSPSSVARDVVQLVEDLDADGFFIFVKSNATEPPVYRGDDGQYAMQPSTGKVWIKQDGLWSYLGIYKAFKFDPSAPAWVSTATYAASDVKTHAGKLWVSTANNNIGHEPAEGSTYWTLLLSGGDAYDILMFDTDRPASGELVTRIQFSKVVRFYSGLSDSKASAEIAATSSATYTFKKNGSSFATCTFGAGQSSATFVCATNTTFSVGDVLTVYAPATRDATLAGVSITLSGYR